MNFYNKVSLEKILKKFNKLSSADGLAYFENDDNQALFRRLTKDSKDMDEYVYSIFNMQLIKSIKESDLYILPDSKQENDCHRIIQLFAFELVHFNDINILIRFLSLFRFSNSLRSRIAHLMTGCIHDDDDLNRVQRYLTNNQFTSLIHSIEESRRVHAIGQQVIEEYRLRERFRR